MTVTLVQVEGRRLTFDVEAHDAVELVSAGTHRRSVIDRARFDALLARKTDARA